MPPINRTNIIEYVILSITDGKTKMLDLTTLANKRNYKHKLINELKAQVDRRSPVFNEFKNSNVDAIEVEVLDAINGTYLDAVNYMNKIATKYNYKTPKAINNTILDIQLELQANKRLSEPQKTPTPEEPERLSEPHTLIEKQLSEPTLEEPERLSEPHTLIEKRLSEPTPTTSGIVKKPKKAVQKIKLKQAEEVKQLSEPHTLIEEAINTPINTQDRITIDYEEDEELEPVEFNVILPTPTTSRIVKTTKKQATKPPVVIEIDRDEDEEDKEITPPKPKLTKKQEQQKNKLIEDNTQTINEYYTLQKQKESLEAKMNTLHLAILNNYTTLANTFNYVDGSISDFNFE